MNIRRKLTYIWNTEAFKVLRKYHLQKRKPERKERKMLARWLQAQEKAPREPLILADTHIGQCPEHIEEMLRGSQRGTIDPEHSDLLKKGALVGHTPYTKGGTMETTENPIQLTFYRLYDPEGRIFSRGGAVIAMQKKPGTERHKIGVSICSLRDEFRKSWKGRGVRIAVGRLKKKGLENLYSVEGFVRTIWTQITSRHGYDKEIRRRGLVLKKVENR